MEKNNDRDTKFELLTNKLNKMLFRFLIREYYSVSINPFYCLKLLTKIIHNDVNDNLKEQCALFLVYILQNLCVTQSLHVTIRPIIADMFDMILTRKKDYRILLYYIFYLVRTNNVQIALRELNVYSQDKKFMNSGEVLFYQVIIEYMIEKKTDSDIFIKGLDKAVKLIKKNKFYYYNFILDFCAVNKLYKDLKNVLMLNESISIFLNDFPNKKKVYWLICNVEDESLNRLTELSKYLNENSFNIAICHQFKELAESYYNENFLDGDTEKFVNKLLRLNEDFLIEYLSFIMNYYMYQLFDDEVIMYISEAFNEIDELINIEKKMLFKDSSKMETFKFLFLSFYKNLIFNVLKGKIKKKILIWMKKNMISEGNDKVEKVVYITNLTKKIITGKELIEITPEQKEQFISKEFITYINKLSFN